MEFTLTSGTFRVTDPCYDGLYWTSGIIGIINNARKGKWKGVVTSPWGMQGRVAELQIVQENYTTASKMWESAGFSVGVDSGQAGFFDAALYPEWSEENNFYDTICKGTLSENQYAVVPFGIASSTGYGDGEYKCYVAKNIEGEVIAAKIVFIGDEDEE